MLDFTRLAGAYNFPIITSGHTHCRPGWVQTQCPYCGRDGSHGGWYLGFDTEKGSFHCWRCGTLRVYPVLATLLRLPEGSEELRKVIDKYQSGTQLPKRAPQPRARTIAPPPDMQPLNGAHKAYLRGRLFDPDAIATAWQVSGTGRFGGIWAWRLVYPVHNLNGVVVAYQGRSIGGADPKYKFSDDKDCLTDPRMLLYGQNRVPGKKIIVVEGCTGVWRIGAGAVATFGIDWDMAHVHLLRPYTHRYIIFDPEEKAQQRAMALARHLAIFGGVTEIVNGFSSDPGAFSDSLAIGLRKELLGV